MSRRRPQLDGPAFCLTTVESVDPDVAPVQCAAHTMPMSEILPHVMLGSWRDLDDPESLKHQNVTHVLNVAREVDPTAHANALDPFSVMHIPLVDEHRQNMDQFIDAACDFIEQARAAQGRVLVHCRRGISRSPAIVVGYLMKHLGLRYDAALDFTKERRKCVSLNMAFRDFLERLDETMLQDRTKAEALEREGPSTAPSFAREGSGYVGPSPGCSSGDSTADSRFPTVPLVPTVSDPYTAPAAASPATTATGSPA